MDGQPAAVNHASPCHRQRPPGRPATGPHLLPADGPAWTTWWSARRASGWSHPAGVSGCWVAVAPCRPGSCAGCAPRPRGWPRSRSGRCCACAAPGWEPWRRSRHLARGPAASRQPRTERIEGDARRHRSSRRPLAQGTTGGGLTPDQKRGVGQAPLFSAIFCWASASAAFRALTWCPSASPTTFVMARVTAGSTFSAAERG